MQTASVITELDAFPRLPLGKYPTPIEYLPQLSQETGRQIYVKRDDGIGPGLGGNKTRKLEYLIADARLRGAQKLVTFGGLQSNHTRLTAAVAHKVSMKPHLIYFEPRPTQLKGNLLINQLLGARMHFIPIGVSASGMTLETTNRLIHWLAFLLVGPHYFIPVGGFSLTGCLGYVRAALEINNQATDQGIENAFIVVAAGCGGTLAGLLAGLKLINSTLQPLGIDIGNLWKGFSTSIARMAELICQRLDQPHHFSLDEIPLIEAGYKGHAYGIPSPEGVSAMKRLAQLEGLLLDPIYTAKAFAGLLDLIEQGQIGQDEPLIFLHTGGLPAVFSFEDYEKLEVCS